MLGVRAIEEEYEINSFDSPSSSDNNILRGLTAQIRTNFWWITVVMLVLLALTAIVVHLHLNTHIIVTELFVDPVEFGVQPQHVGMYSYASATTLVVAGSIMLFTGWAAVNIAGGVKGVLLVLGAMLLWLGLDDVFMIHEWVGLRLAWLIQSDNVPHDRQWLGSAVFGNYGIALGVILIYFRQQIFRTPWILLGLACTGLALSVLIDLNQFLPFVPSPTGGTQGIIWSVMEDMFKLAGGAFAMAYGVRLSRDVIQNRHANL